MFCNDVLTVRAWPSAGRGGRAERGVKQRAIARRAEGAELSASNKVRKIPLSMQVRKFLNFCESIFSWRGKNEGVVFSTANPSRRHYYEMTPYK